MMSVGQTCDDCNGHSARAARYCQWCGSELRALEAFETEVSA
jgi:DnaJ-class molecular chaperone